MPGIEARPRSAETKLVIRQIRVVGATIYTAAQLAELYADVIGKTVTLQAVYDDKLRQDIVGCAHFRNSRTGAYEG